MQTRNGTNIELKINELTTKIEDHLRPIFENWRHTVPKQIEEKIKYPLFMVKDDKTIGLNFAKEVIIVRFSFFKFIIIYFNLFEA